MRFLVYVTAPFSGTSHIVLRGGDAPENMIALQADDGETAIPAPAGWNGSAAPGTIYDSATNETSFIAPPGGGAIGADGLAAIHADIRERLRRTDWTQLPDAPLTSGEKADYDTFRAALRAGAASINASSTSGYGINSSIDTPPGGIYDEPF